MSSDDPSDDPVPSGLTLGLDEAFRVLEALEDARSLYGNVAPHPVFTTSW